MSRNTKKKITYPSRVLVSSYITLSESYKVVALQISSCFNRARLNFQGFSRCVTLKWQLEKAVEISVKALQTEQSLGYIKLVALASCQLRSQDKVSISMRGNSRAKTF